MKFVPYMMLNCGLGALVLLLEIFT